MAGCGWRSPLSAPVRHRIGYSARVRLLFIIDPLDRLGLAGDTSYALMVEASRREHEIWTCQIEHLGLEHDDPVAAAQLTLVREAETPREAFSVEARMPIPLDAFDMVLMRKDPPVDVNYLHATWILEHRRGARAERAVVQERALRIESPVESEVGRRRRELR